MSDSAAGWYPDPRIPGQFRFWDGESWTGQTQLVVPQAADPGNTRSIIAIVLGVVALVFLPPFTGGAGVILGFSARKRGERLATVAIDVAIAGIVLGMVIGFALAYRVLHQAGV